MMRLDPCGYRIRISYNLCWLANVQLLWLSTVFAADLPELDLPSTLSGAATSARFFGGATRDGALTFKSSFQSHEAIDVTAEIQVEPEQVGSAGEIYIIAEISGQFFMRVSDGTYLPWDLQTNTL
jgi:hypothetical protein